jgi:hypothetical protein
MEWICCSYLAAHYPERVGKILTITKFHWDKEISTGK